MTLSTHGVRRPRFRRGPCPPLKLTDDDVTILRLVAKHRFLSSKHFVQLLPHRSPKKLIERLGALYHSAYLDRPRAQLIYYATSGSAPMVYGLGNKGAELLASDHPSLSVKVDWTWKNRAVGQIFIAHTLMTADVMVAMQMGVQHDAVLRLIPSEEIARGRSDAFVLKAKPQGCDQTIIVIPDAVFGLENSTVQKFFLVEADRGTMPVVRSDLDRTSIARKFRAYLAGGGSGNAFGQQLGIGNFRVLVVTTSTDRKMHMIQALRDLTRGAGSRQFLFATHDELCAARNLLTLEWTSGKGEATRLLD